MRLSDGAAKTFIAGDLVGYSFLSPKVIERANDQIEAHA